MSSGASNSLQHKGSPKTRKASNAKSIAVKTLVDFSAKSGSLKRNFTPGPTSEEGIEGHRRLASLRNKNYQTELALHAKCLGIEIRGRADGYCPEKDCLEEIKTFYGEVERIPENQQALHWAQLKIYGWMWCLEMGVDDAHLALVYFNLQDEKEYRFEEHYSAKDLATYAKTLVRKYCQWQTLVEVRRERLVDWSNKLTFPFAEMYPPQRYFAETVYKAAALGKVLLAEAPTGTGKTLATIFPAIKAFPHTAVDKIFYLTSKSTGKQLALNQLKLLVSPQQDAASASLQPEELPAPLRILEITALEKACLAPDKRCDGDDCVFAKDFYTKLEKVRLLAAEMPLLDKEHLDVLAHQFDICPFYLSMEMSRWVDVVVTDINYYFDINALLFGLVKQFQWKPYLLVDESHNLIDRSRSMYTAELERRLLFAAKKHLPSSLKKAADRVNRSWLDIINKADETEFSLLNNNLPERFEYALSDFINTYIQVLQQFPDHPMQKSNAHDFFFSLVNFVQLLEIVKNEEFDGFCLDLYAAADKQEVLTLRNVIPAGVLSARIKKAHCACFFSATLIPKHYFQQLIGLEESSVAIDVESPFHSDQLDVRVATDVSTRFKDRQAAIDPICEVICRQLQEQPGNALVFFSSYDFLNQVKKQLINALPTGIQLLTQTRSMNESERLEFIASFSAANNVLGLAVLGGVFSEGIDLVGDALKGVFIATLGMPKVTPVNDCQSRMLEARFGSGYDFTYLFPGLQKVIQAAGRVIRSTSDTGYLWLLDDRFSQQRIDALLPSNWAIRRVAVKQRQSHFSV